MRLLNLVKHENRILIRVIILGISFQTNSAFYNPVSSNQQLRFKQLDHKKSSNNTESDHPVSEHYSQLANLPTTFFLPNYFRKLDSMLSSMLKQPNIITVYPWKWKIPVNPLKVKRDEDKTDDVDVDYPDSENAVPEPQNLPSYYKMVFKGSRDHKAVNRMPSKFKSLLKQSHPNYKRVPVKREEDQTDDAQWEKTSNFEKFRKKIIGK